MAVRLFGYSISNAGLEHDLEFAFNTIAERQGCRYMACANPHSLVVASRDDKFRNALQNADLLLPDGSGIVLAARLLHNIEIEKVAGHDFFTGICKRAERYGKVKFFFLGSNEKVLSSIKSRMTKEFPNIEICGTYSPPYKDQFTKEENLDMVDAVNSASPDILWVGMTAPKQEKWLFDNYKMLNVPFAAAIGAVFDFYAGTKKRSSDIWIRLGLEWLPRFLKEPRRLWERNLKSTPIFLGWILRKKIKQITKGNI